jgi:hypothetical protein
VIVAVPPAIPVKRPVVAPMVAIVVLLLLHVPPATELLNNDVVPIQTVVAPAIAAGSGLTVTIFMAKQPVVAV